MYPVERHGEPRQPHRITPTRYRGVATECIGQQQDGDHHNRTAHPYEWPNGIEPVCLHNASLLLTHWNSGEVSPGMDCRSVSLTLNRIQIGNSGPRTYTP